MAQNKFGKLLRYYRRSAQDRLNGGSLSQDRLADLLSERSGITYSRGAISDWERGKGHIHKDARLLLVSLIAILHAAGGIQTLEEANEWLEAGNYRTLNLDEIEQVSTRWLAEEAKEPTPNYIFNAPTLPVHEIIGRSELLITLKQQLFTGHNIALSALNGLPGVGKTTLAILLAHDSEVKARFPDGVLWVGLGRNPDTFHLLGQWARFLGIQQSDLEQMGAIQLRVKAIHEALLEKQMLIVIDDVWDQEPVQLFRLGSADCVHILTTRQPRIAVEFAGDNTLKVPELTDAYAFELLRRLAPRIVAEEEKAAREIVQLSGGLPLSLVLIGNYLRIHEATGRKRRIQSALENMSLAEKRFQVESSQSIMDAKIHPSLPLNSPISLSTIIGTSDGALAPETRLVLRALAVFPPKPNTFSEEAALFVADGDTDALDELSDHGLLETMNRERYTLHQSIVDYTRLQTVNPAHLERLAIYYQRFASEQADDQFALSEELENISAALAAAKSIERNDLLWGVLDAIFSYLEVKGYYELAIEYLEYLAEQDLEDAVQAKICNHLGRIAYKRNDNDTATKYWKKGLHIAQSSGAHDEALSVLSNLSMVTSENGRYHEASTYLEEAVEHATAVENWYEVCRVHGNLGRLAIISDRYTEADKHLVMALSVAEEHDFPNFACAIHNMRGIVAKNLGEVEIAYQHYFAGLQVARQNRFTTRTLEQLVNIGELLNDLGRFEEAEAYLQEGLTLARDLDDHSKEGHILLDLGIAAFELGNLEQADAYLEAGYGVAQAADDQRLVAYILAQWGTVDLSDNRLEIAAQRLEHSLSIVPHISRQAQIAGLAHFGLAKIALAKDDIVTAEQQSLLGLQATEGTGHTLFEEIQTWRTSLVNN